MLTKNAMGNMINRYTAVLKKCRLINFFGLNAFATLSMASTITLGTVGGLNVGDAWAASSITDYTPTSGYTFSTTTSSNVYFTVDGVKYYVLKNGEAITTADKTDNRVDGGTPYTEGAGDFILLGTGETTYAEGGAFYNSGTISTSITSNFIGNAATYGGAIYNDGWNAAISTITGDFIANTATYGGAIYNYDWDAKISSISADFYGNSAMSGGAIYNNYGTIGTISGDFIGNMATNFGGAIYNNYQITTTISGDFSYNSAIDTFDGIASNHTVKSSGGAIYNIGEIVSISGDFTGNSVTGAIASEIYTTPTLNVLPPLKP